MDRYGHRQSLRTSFLGGRMLARFMGARKCCPRDAAPSAFGLKARFECLGWQTRQRRRIDDVGQVLSPPRKGVLRGPGTRQPSIDQRGPELERRRSFGGVFGEASHHELVEFWRDGMGHAVGERRRWLLQVLLQDTERGLRLKYQFANQ